MKNLTEIVRLKKSGIIAAVSLNRLKLGFCKKPQFWFSCKSAVINIPSYVIDHIAHFEMFKAETRSGSEVMWQKAR